MLTPFAAVIITPVLTGLGSVFIGRQQSAFSRQYKERIQESGPKNQVPPGRSSDYASRSRSFKHKKMMKDFGL